MKRRELKNVAASVRQRLLNEALARGRPFNELLLYFAMERFLCRLSASPHGEKFVLKGALMLAAWGVSLTRPTKDIDLLGHVVNDIESIAGMVREICGQEIQPDGLLFDPAAIGVFLGPVVEALHDGREFKARWLAPGPWSPA